MAKKLELSDNAMSKICEAIIVRLKQIDSNWEQPWVSVSDMIPTRNFYGSVPYRGVNAFLTQLMRDMNSYKTPYFMTFNQIYNKTMSYKYENLALKKFVKDGKEEFEKPFPIIKTIISYYNPKANPRKIYADAYNKLDDNEQKNWHPFLNMKVFYEFNIDQTDFAEKYPDDYKKLVDSLSKLPKDFVHNNDVEDKVLDAMFEGKRWITNDVIIGGDKAYFIYSSTDKTDKGKIYLPPKEHFISSSKFFSTAIHEAAHSTSIPLKRDCNAENNPKFGYMLEELKAEISAAVICSQLGIEKTIDKEHLQYIKNWINALSQNVTIIEEVMEDVQKICNFFMKKYTELEKDLVNETPSCDDTKELSDISSDPTLPQNLTGLSKEISKEQLMMLEFMNNITGIEELDGSKSTIEKIHTVNKDSIEIITTDGVVYDAQDLLIQIQKGIIIPQGVDIEDCFFNQISSTTPLPYYDTGEYSGLKAAIINNSINIKSNLSHELHESSYIIRKIPICKCPCYTNPKELLVDIELSNTSNRCKVIGLYIKQDNTLADASQALTIIQDKLGINLTDLSKQVLSNAMRAASLSPIKVNGKNYEIQFQKSIGHNYTLLVKEPYQNGKQKKDILVK